MEELLTLPGVGRKTANLVLILAHRERRQHLRRHPRPSHLEPSGLGRRPGRPTRPSRRSTRACRRKWWPVVNLYLVTWGQNVCRPLYPLCGSCVAGGLVSENRRQREGYGEAESSRADRELTTRVDAEVPMKLTTRPRRWSGRSLMLPSALPREACRAEARHGASAEAAGPVIVLDTAKGTIEFETYPEDAPKTVAQIVELVKKNFYNGQRFHRAEENFAGPDWRSDVARHVAARSGGAAGRAAASRSASPRSPRSGSTCRGAVGDGASGRSEVRRQPVLHGDPAAPGARRQVHGLRPGDQRASTWSKKIQRADVLKKASVK